MTQNGLMGKNNAGDRGIEPGRNRPSNTATDKYIGAENATRHLPQKTAHRRAKMNKRAILPNRCPTTSGNERGEGRAKTRPYIKFIITAVRCVNGIRRPVPTRNAKNRFHGNNQKRGNKKTDQRPHRNRQAPNLQRDINVGFTQRRQPLHANHKTVGDDGHNKTKGKSTKNANQNSLRQNGQPLCLCRLVFCYVINRHLPDGRCQKDRPPQLVP